MNRRQGISLPFSTVVLIGSVWFGCAALLPAADAPFEVFAVSDLVRVFEDGYALPDERAARIDVFGLRGETVSAQAVVQARRPLKQLAVFHGPLQLESGSAVIPADHVGWNFVKSIFIEENTPKLLPSDLIRQAPAWFPDCLGDESQCALDEGRCKAVYLTIKIPSDAPAGQYQSAIAFADGGERRSLPIQLTVYPLAIPQQRHVKVTEWFSTSRFRTHHGVESSDSPQFWRMLALYARNMVEHRQNVFRISLELIDSVQTASGELRCDFSQFDRWAEVFWSSGGMDLLETGFVARFGADGWSGSEIVLRDFSVRDEATGRSQTVPGEQFLPRFLPALVQHLREKNWLDKTIFHICDEPSNHNVVAWRAASEFVHRIAPELRRVDAIETPHCLDRLEIWTPKLDYLAAWQDMYQQAQREGNELWFYTVGIFQKGSLPNKTVDVALIESRVMHWLNYRFGLTGYLHWGFNSWTDDPIAAPGRHRGDGWHVYPAKDGLLNSLRWEQMRNGLQDYECLWLLEDRIAQIKSQLSGEAAQWIEPTRRGVEIAAQVVESYDRFTRDPAVLYAARKQAIEETLQLDQSPRVILQTNPLEHSLAINDGAIDVYGWVEPGAKITVNGQVLPVSPEGLFIEQLPLSRQGTIVLAAEHAQGKKTITRQFRWRYPKSP